MGSDKEVADQIPGAQALRRGLEVLRVLAHDPAAGAGLQQVMQETGLSRSTAHRLLMCLAEEGFAAREEGRHSYRLGTEMMRLGFASMQRPPIVSKYRGVLKRLARLSSETVLLMARTGDYCVCLSREDSDACPSILRTRVGQMWPLGVGAGGMAILAALPSHEVSSVFDRHSLAFEAAGLSRSLVMRMIARGQRDGYVAMIDTVTRGVGGVAAALHGSESFAAIVIADVRRNLSAMRREELGRILCSSI